LALTKAKKSKKKVSLHSTFYVGSRMIKGLDPDMGSGMRKWSDPDPGKTFPDPQHWFTNKQRGVGG
jgi:hypothetical protein